MGISEDIKNIGGVVTVEIEGFFTERFINLCKINNVKIWDIRTLVKGVVRFKMNIKEFKKLRKIARKTKCRVKIKDKKGLYFKLFRYRKRKFVILLLFLVIIFSVAFSTFIWNINISGNSRVSEEQILNTLKENGVKIGSNKIGIEKKDIINKLRVSLNDISWVGIEINGTTMEINVVEKTIIDEEQVQNTKLGDIVANKSGVITKIVPENGTAKFKVGSYVEEGMTLIEGTLYSKFLDPEYVTAKGIVYIDSEYVFEKEYKFVNVNKEYTSKTKYSIGFTLNSKEKYINYLNKSKKYDISKKSKKINIFGKELLLSLYRFDEYNETEIKLSQSEILEQARKEAKDYIENDILKNISGGNIKSQEESIDKNNNSIKYKMIYTVNERIGKFVERNNND